MTKTRAHLLTLIPGLWLIGCGTSDGAGNPVPTPGASGSANIGGSPSTGVAGARAESGGAFAAGGAGAGSGGSQQTGGSSQSGSAGLSGTSGATAGGSGNAGAAGAGKGGGASGGSAGASGGGAGSAGSAAGGGSSTAAVASDGCTKTPTLKNNGYNTIMSGGKSRQYYLRWPTSYDKAHPYRLILSFHGAGGKGTDVAPGFFGLFDLANGSTAFIAPDASGGTWSAATDTTFVDDILKAVEADLCIDTTRVELEGFSQGAAMAWTLTCSRPKVFRAVVGHSGGGITNPTTCQPVPYLGSLGLSDISGNSQKTQTDQFAKWNGCTIETLPTAPTGGHICTNYKGCPVDFPVRWCSYDGGHTPSPNDAGKSTSWMPSEVWPFLSKF